MSNSHCFLPSPGRFLAAVELKLLLAHLVTTYDVRLEDDGVDIPAPTRIGFGIIPDMKAKVFFKKRTA